MRSPAQSGAQRHAASTAPGEGPALPPSSNTGAEITLGLHWLRGVTWGASEDQVREDLALRLGESVVVLDHGHNGYTSAALVGPLRVMAAPERPDMGVLIEANGSACEQLGGAEVARIARDFGLRLSRFDLAWDGVEVPPGGFRDAWCADQVRTRCKVPEKAREDRPWRTCDWRSNAEGDTFSMGARQSSQMVRVYDARGFNRVELEVKHALAEKVGGQLIDQLANGDGDTFRVWALGLLRRFVDFVDANAATNRSRAPLLSWWGSFVGGAAKARVTLTETVVRTVDEIEAWVERQVAPALALLDAVHGMRRLQDIARNGRRRWGRRHRQALLLRGAGVPVGAA